MLVKMTFAEPKTVDLVGEDGHPEGQTKMPAHVFHFVNAAGETITAKSGETHDVPDDVYKRCLKPYGMAEPVAEGEKPKGEKKAEK